MTPANGKGVIEALHKAAFPILPNNLMGVALFVHGQSSSACNRIWKNSLVFSRFSRNWDRKSWLVL